MRTNYQNVDGGDRSRVSTCTHEMEDFIPARSRDGKLRQSKVNYARESLCDYPGADKAYVSHAITLVLPSPLRRAVPLYRSSILPLCPPDNFTT